MGERDFRCFSVVFSYILVRVEQSSEEESALPKSYVI